MSPDIHWHIGEDNEQRTVVKSTSPRRSRRSWLAILIVVMLGAGLGLAYRSLPEPPPRRTPALPSTSETLPTRSAIPAALYQTIDREVQALADGDFEKYRELHAPNEFVGQQNDFKPWRRPSDDRPLYEIVDFDLEPNSRAWADIRQFRDGRYFRQTRFYHRAENQWLRVANPGFYGWQLWSGQEERLQTLHFDVIYMMADRTLISPILRQMEEDYQALCRDLGCATLGHELTFTVRMTHANVPFVYPMSSGTSEIHLPKARVMGLYESGRAYSWNTSAVHWTLAQAIIEQVDGTVHWDQPGGGLLWAGGVWAVEHIDPIPVNIWNQLDDLSQKPLLSLEALWDLGGVNEPGPALAQLNQLLCFIKQEHGSTAVTRLLGSIASARSMSDVIENGLGVPFAEFEQKWQAWLKQGAAAVP